MSKIIKSLRGIFSTSIMVILGLGPFCYMFIIIPGLAFLKERQIRLIEKTI